MRSHLILLFSTMLCIISMFPSLASAKEIVVWHSYRSLEKEAFDSLVAKYNEANKKNGIRVKSLAVPYDAYPDKITAAIPRGKGPDVFIFAQDRLGGWVESGNTIESIDFYLEDDLRAKFLPGLLDAMTYNETVYGLPFNFKSIVLIYNKDKIKTPPTTEKELLMLAKQHTDSKSGRYGMAYTYNDFFFHAMLMNAYGGQVFDKRSTPVINSKENLVSLEHLQKWLDVEKVLPSEPSSALITSMFNEGKTSMIFSGPWTLAELDTTKVNYDIAVLPTLNNGQPLKPWLTIEGVYISAGSQEKEKAFDFAQFLVTEESAMVMAQKGKQLPSIKSVYESGDFAQKSSTKIFRKQFENAIAMPNYPEMTLMWSPMTTAMNKVVKKSASPKDALNEAQNKLQENVKKLHKGK
ncbi:MAG: extracellular solute-binding protein [Pseudomonadota bacterium]